MQLIRPDVTYKDSYIAAVKEFKSDTDASHRSQDIKKLSIEELEADFTTFVEKKRSHERGENLPDGGVPVTEYWLVDEGDYFGRISIRHRLNEHLEKFIGHIGYDIRPSQRGKGFATKMLALALIEAKKLGIDRVLVTCDSTNIASRRVIERNDGVLENGITEPESGVTKLRFWIDTTAPR